MITRREISCLILSLSIKRCFEIWSVSTLIKVKMVVLRVFLHHFAIWLTIALFLFFFSSLQEKERSNSSILHMWVWWTTLVEHAYIVLHVEMLYIGFAKLRFMFQVWSFAVLFCMLFYYLDSRFACGMVMYTVSWFDALC